MLSTCTCTRTCTSIHSSYLPYTYKSSFVSESRQKHCRGVRKQGLIQFTDISVCVLKCPWPNRPDAMKREESNSLEEVRFDENRAVDALRLTLRQTHAIPSALTFPDCLFFAEVMEQSQVLRLWTAEHLQLDPCSHLLNVLSSVSELQTLQDDGSLALFIVVRRNWRWALNVSKQLHLCYPCLFVTFRSRKTKLLLWKCRSFRLGRRTISQVTGIRYMHT